MNSDQKPIYVSPRSFRSLWQEYRIYPDRLELECWIALHKLVIPATEIVEIEIRPPFVPVDLFRGKSLRYSSPLKMDCADVQRHVAVIRKSGFMRHLRFTPADPDKFVEVCKSIMKKD